jgi:putative transcriptional regulator
MRPIQIIRSRLGVSQSQLAAGMQCSQPNVSAYERGQQIPPDVAGRLIEFARQRGLALTYDHVYGAAEVPHLARPQPVAQG